MGAKINVPCGAVDRTLAYRLYFYLNILTVYFVLFIYISLFTFIWTAFPKYSDTIFWYKNFLGLYHISMGI